VRPTTTRTEDHQRETYSRVAGGLISGETVTPGAFRCAGCGYEHRVEKGKVTNLPVCPRCQGERWQLE
jgi:predicted Zn-ribbon and HTH transcriptional regulator